MIASPVAQPQDVYTDLNSLQSINDIGREDKDLALRKVAEQFESMFVKMMMKSMRDANKVFQEDSIMHSPEEDFYQQMYDDQMSVSLTGKQGMGFADVIYRQLNQEYGDPSKRPEVQWQPIDDRRKHFSHAIEFNPNTKKNLQLNPVKAKEGFEIDTRFIKQNKAAIDAAVIEEANDKPSSSHITSSEVNKPNVERLNVEKLKKFETPEDFIQQLYPAAEKMAKEMGISPKAIISQAALETGWGKFMIHDETGKNSYNFFGIKADSRWQGENATVTTHEYRDGKKVTEKASFRSYASIEEGLKDYSTFLKAQRYSKAMAAGTDVKQYATELQKAGYATDPEYAQKITRIAGSDVMTHSLSKQRVEVPRG